MNALFVHIIVQRYELSIDFDIENHSSGISKEKYYVVWANSSLVIYMGIKIGKDIEVIDFASWTLGMGILLHLTTTVKTKIKWQAGTYNKLARLLWWGNKYKNFPKFD